MSYAVFVALCVAVTFASGVFLGGVWRSAQRRCMHHDRHTGQSWVLGQLVDVGRWKIWHCTHCGKVWT